MHKLPLRIRRHLKTSEEERALLFCRRGCTVQLLQQSESTLELKRQERYLQLTEDLNSLRWSWTQTLHVEQIVHVHHHSKTPFKLTIHFAALNGG